MISVSLIICCLVPPLNSVPSSTLQAWRFHRWPNSLISAKHMITIITALYLNRSYYYHWLSLPHIWSISQMQFRIKIIWHTLLAVSSIIMTMLYLMHKMINFLTRGDHMPNLITSLKHWALGILQLWPLLTQRQHNKLSDRMDDKIESLFPIDQ